MSDDPTGGPEFARILAENERYTRSFDRSALTAAPLRGLAVLACMDSRLDVHEALGLRVGDAHVLRNAGGLATDDAIRSLVVSQHLLGTDTIVVIQHTGCGLLAVDEDRVRGALARTTGHNLDMPLGSFGDLEANVRMTVERLRAHPWLRRGPVHGTIFDVATGRLHVVPEEGRGEAAPVS